MKSKNRRGTAGLAVRALLKSGCCATTVVLGSLPVIAGAADEQVMAAATEPATLPKVRVVDEVLVEATRYATPKTTSATKTDTALRDVPQSVSVITS